MRPRERREAGEQDLFRSRLDQIIDMKHALVKLSRAIDWRALEERFGSVYTDGPGSSPLPTRLMAGITVLKYMHDLSDEAVCDRWVENPYFQFFCGEEFFQHRLVFDRSSLTRWRQRMREEKLQALLQESLAVATRRSSSPCRLCADRQAGADQAPALRPRPPVQARQQGPAQAQNLSGSGDPRRRPKDRRQRRLAGGPRQAHEPGSSGARPRPPPARPEGLFPACPGSGVHRQRQSAPALRVRRQGQRRDPPQAFKRRPVRRPCGGVARQSLRRPHARHCHFSYGANDRQHHRAGPHRCRISRPQCAAQSQVQDLHRRPEASRYTADQTRVQAACCGRARDRSPQGRAPHGMQSPRSPRRRRHHHACRGRLQLPHSAQVAQPLVARNLGRPHGDFQSSSRLKVGKFTDDATVNKPGLRRSKVRPQSSPGRALTLRGGKTEWQVKENTGLSLSHHCTLRSPARPRIRLCFVWP